MLFLSSIAATTNYSGNAYETKGKRCKAKTSRSEGHNGVCTNSSNSAGAVAQSYDQEGGECSGNSVLLRY